MEKLLTILLLLAFLLTGCTAFVDNSYLVVEKHSEQPTVPNETAIEEADVISNRSQLRWAVLSCISDWAENSTLLVENYEDDLSNDLSEILNYATQEYPIGAYAVDFIDAELNGDAQKGSISLSIVFRRSAAEIKSIVTVNTTSAALRRIEQALRSCQTALTFRIRDYDEVDFSAAIQEYCLENPNTVPAIPDFSAEVYPPKGETRILELHFTYPDTREELQLKLSSVNTILSSAKSYIQAGADDQARVELLSRFLTTRFNYQIASKTPSMPAYDLLCGGLAHSLSFAAVFRYECSAVGMDCLLVEGMRNEQRHYWNIVRIDDVYYHVDLMRSIELGETELQLLPSQTLLEEGYVWNQEAYPETFSPEETEEHEATQITESNEPTESTGESQSSEPTESTEESQSSEPTESTDESQSSEPTESTDESQSSEPTESTEESQSSEPTESTEPTSDTAQEND